MKRNGLALSLVVLSICFAATTIGHYAEFWQTGYIAAFFAALACGAAFDDTTSSRQPCVV